jgi:drug/metabolite transporter (DMT)-like permease
LLAGAIATLWLARPHGRRSVVAAALALGGILLAAIAGMAHVMSGENKIAPYLIALGFIVALCGYAVEFVAIEDGPRH